MEHPWEDNLLERKVEGDLKDLLKTMVAFANSVMPGHTAVILIGERDNGEVAGVTNPDNIQKAVQKTAELIYPRMISRSRVYEVEGKFCVRVEIEFSGETPHFGGPAWVRNGSQTIKASDEVFQKLIEIRLGIVRQLSLWLNAAITIAPDQGTVGPGGSDSYFGYAQIGHRLGFLHEEALLISVNQFWATWKLGGSLVNHSEPLSKLTLSFDDENHRLMILVTH